MHIMFHEIFNMKFNIMYSMIYQKTLYDGNNYTSFKLNNQHMRIS